MGLVIGFLGMGAVSIYIGHGDLNIDVPREKITSMRDPRA